MGNYRKRILFILPSLGGGGAEKGTLNIIRSLDRKKYAPILFLLKKDGILWDEIPADVAVITGLQPNQRIRFNFIMLFKKLLHVAQQADILIGALELVSTYIAVFAGLLLRLPVLGIVCIDLKFYPPAKQLLHRILIRLTYPRLKRCIAVSSGVENSILDLVPRLKGKTKTIYRSVQLNRVRSLAKEPINFLKPGPLVIAAGRLIPLKGFDILIRAHAKLFAQSIFHHLIILGEGHERSNLEILTNKLGVKNTVHMPGYKFNPFAWMAKADAFVLSSRYEGFSNVLLEAMAVGIPIVSTDCPCGPAEILENGCYGLMVPPNDVDALALAISQVLTNPGLADKLRKAGLKRIKDFSQNSAHEYEKIFSEFTT